MHGIRMSYARSRGGRAPAGAAAVRWVACSRVHTAPRAAAAAGAARVVAAVSGLASGRRLGLGLGLGLGRRRHHECHDGGECEEAVEVPRPARGQGQSQVQG
eukprot:scaffold37894_cov52-Phaeocystis_antarctica.AAC.1